MLNVPTRIYLASRSPRRRELLKQIGVNFEVLLFREHFGRGADVDEVPHPGEKPEDYVRRVTRDKADTGWLRVQQRALPRHPVLAADTEVALGERIFGKPANRADAAAMLRALAGREHRVLTGVAIRYEEFFEMAMSETVVRFGPMSEQDIMHYVESGEPLDKAGAYAIQGRAAAFIPEILGSYSGVMGLPLHETAQLLARIPRY
ncbi:MAG: Maf family nucleotide pyrophosphatase [Burkholderiales bacterium]|nr:Maf family nucleotide pyrophosphatase [Burkholderiales bacterium]